MNKRMAEAQLDLYQKLPEQIASLQTQLDSLDSEISQLESQSPRDSSKIYEKKLMRLFSKSQLQTMNKTLERYQAWNADPANANTPFNAMASDPQQMTMNYYESLPTSIANIQDFLELYRSRLAELEPNSSEAQMMQQQIDMSTSTLASQNTQLAQYQAHQADPVANPLPQMMGASSGMLGGGGFTSLTSSPRNECSSANENYQMALLRLKHGTPSDSPGTCGMSDAELTGLAYYIGSGYVCLNPYLRGEAESSPDVDKLVETVNAGLRRLPRYQGLVLRGATLPESVRAQHTVGAVIEYPSYTSTSSGTPFPGADHFIIYSETGRPVMTINPGESEVLFLPKTKFKVLELTETNGVRTYVMREHGARSKNSPSDSEILDQVHASLAQESPEATPPTFNSFSSFSNSDSYVCPADGSASIPRVHRQLKAPATLKARRLDVPQGLMSIGM